MSFNVGYVWRKTRLQASLVLFWGSAVFGLPAPDALAQTVAVQEGKVIYTDGAGKDHALTQQGLDQSATLSPDHRCIAFVRATPARWIDVGPGKAQATEIWIVRTDGTGAHRILSGRDSDKPEQALADMASLQFSPDGRLLYFKSKAWVTSDAVHAVDLKTGREHFVQDGNALDLLRSGPYAGDLLVRRHKHWLGGGSYDWVWLLDPEGHEIGAVGPDDETVDKFKRVFTK
ncbi:MAG: hypothetical protein JOY60_09525 [Burkholderiaceae bacterium]|nr:hypothetical protein [Roseateles sp.]MBV8470083.1 hypothetical protein [Burkholderiaceae bacterium]